MSNETRNLIAATNRGIEIAELGRKDGLVTHTVEQSRALVSAIESLTAERDRLAGELAELRAQEPVAWRYQSGTNYRYRGYVSGFDIVYAMLKPIPLYAAPVPASVPDDVARDALRHIAALAHNGGLMCAKEWEVLAAIRALSLLWWDNRGTLNDMRDRADAAMLAAAQSATQEGE